MECGCHCIRCGSARLESARVGDVEPDGYYDMHHTCQDCGDAFSTTWREDVFERCDACGGVGT